jgi:hypothetical protein
MKILRNFSFCNLVWLAKGENFPGTAGMPQKQGYYLLWTGGNSSDYKQSEYLGAIRPHSEYLEMREL